MSRLTHVIVNGQKYPWDPSPIDLSDPDQTREYQLTQSEIDAIFNDWQKGYSEGTSSARDPVCECGGLKTNTGHSTWCPVYKPY